MAKIQSAFLNADQEQAVNNVLTHAKTHLGFSPAFGRIQVPSGLGTIRVVIEASQSRDALVDYIEKLKSGQGLIAELENAVKQFDEVVEHELVQIAEGTQEAVAERDEATQA